MTAVTSTAAAPASALASWTLATGWVSTSVRTTVSRFPEISIGAEVSWLTA